MKKIILSLVCLSVGLFAAENAGKYYVGFNSGVVRSSDDGFFNGHEDLSNLVGDSGVRNEIELGLKSEFYNRDDLYANIFLYGWKNDADKNNEQGGGLGCKFGSKHDSHSFTMGGKAGVGTQATKGDTFRTNTSYTNLSFIFNSSPGLPQTAVFTRNTELIEIDLLLGYAYELTSNISFNANVDYIWSSYQFEYYIPAGSVSLSSVEQDTLYFNVGLKYSF
jgi:hypothetical protein